MKCLTQTFDDDFLLADQFIDQQSSSGVTRFHHHDDAVLRVHGFVWSPEVVAQSKQRRLAAAYADDFAAPLNHTYHPRPGAEGFTNRKGRNDIPVGTDAN